MSDPEITRFEGGVKVKEDNYNGRRFHITFNAYERRVLEMMRVKYGTSLSGALRVCVRAAGIELGTPPTEE